MIGIAAKHDARGSTGGKPSSSLVSSPAAVRNVARDSVVTGEGRRDGVFQAGTGVGDEGDAIGPRLLLQRTQGKVARPVEFRYVAIGSGVASCKRCTSDVTPDCRIDAEHLSSVLIAPVEDDGKIELVLLQGG